MRIVDRRRFFSALGVAVVVIVVGVALVLRSGDGDRRVSTATTVRRTTTTTSTSTTTTLSPTTITTIKARTATTLARRAATPTTAAAATTTAAPVCGTFRSSYTYESESSEMLHISLVSNTSFGGRPVTFEMQYTPPAGGAPSYPTEQYKGKTASYYTLHFRVTKSMDGGALAVLARADGVSATCQSPRYKTSCCLGPPESAPEP